MTHDLPLMMYMALLMDRFGWVPHADFFDMNLLGSYAAYLAIAKTAGYEAAALRWADLTVFAGISALTVYALRPLGRLSGTYTAVLFGILYLRMGPALSLQREYLLVVPMLGAFAVAARWPEPRGDLAPLLSGFLVGCCMTIKPPAAILAVPLLVHFVAERRAATLPSRSLVADAVTVAVRITAGMALPLLVMVGVLAGLGALGAFVDIFTSYLPLYASITAGHRVVPASERLSYLLDGWFLFAPQYPWALGAAVGAGAFFAAGGTADSRQRRLGGLVIGMTLASVIYPMLSGQFWRYHWLPYIYWLVACSSLAFARIRTWRDAGSIAVAVVLILTLITDTIRPDRAWGRLLRDPTPPVEGNRPAEIADFLAPRLQPGDTVQALDWTDAGVIHGMLLARARSATPFLYDFHFHHHVSTDYIRGLRRRFVTALESSRARFIVRGKAGPFPTGPDTTRDFPELEALIQRGYGRVLERPGYEIYERVR
jgi:hypothetical protein